MVSFPGPKTSTQSRQPGNSARVQRADQAGLRRVEATQGTQQVAAPKDYMSDAVKTANRAFSKAAVSFEIEHEKRNKFNAQAEYMEFDNSARRNVAKDADEVEGLRAQTFEIDTLRNFDINAKKYFDSVPDDQKDIIDIKLRKLRHTLSNAAYVKQRSALQQYYSENISTNVNNSLVAVRENPSMLEERFTQISELVTAADISESKKRQALAAARSKLVEQAIYGHANKGDFKTANSLLTNFTKSAAANSNAVTKEPGSIVDRIISVESNNNPNAKNAKSTATGLGQFIDSTWLDMIKRHKPKLAQGKTRAELLELRKNPDLSRELTARYAEQNASVLESAGIEPTAGNVYLAHFLGPAGAKKVLQNEDQVPLEAVLPAEHITANPMLKGKSVGWLRNMASTKMGTGKVTQNVSIGPAWIERVNRRVSSLHQNAVNATSRNIRDEAHQKILMSPESVSEDAILATEGLTTAHQNELLRSLRTAHKKQEDLNYGRTLLKQGDDATALFNERNPKDRKAVDALAADPDTLPHLKVGTPERAIELARRTGIADKKAVTTAVSGINSRDKGEFSASLEFASRLYDASHRAFDGVDGSSQLKDFVRDYQEYRRNNYSPEEAAQAVFNVKHPEGRGNVTQLTSTAAEALKAKELTPAAVVSEIGKSVFGMDPDLALDGQLGPGVVADYRKVWTDQFIKSNGNEEYATLSTRQKLSQIYGSSKLAGASLFGLQGDFVKFPFEQAYKPIDGSYDTYKKDAAAQLSKALNRTISPDDVAIVADPIVTGNDIKQGKPARFRLYYKTDIDGDQIMHTPVGDIFYQPDVNALSKASFAAKSSARLRRQRLDQAPDNITVAVDSKGNEVLVDVLTRQIVKDDDGVITQTGEKYVPPSNILSSDNRARREGVTLNVEEDKHIVQPNPTGPGRRIRTPDDFGEGMRNQWQQWQKSIGKGAQKMQESKKTMKKLTEQPAAVSLIK